MKKKYSALVLALLAASSAYATIGDTPFTTANAKSKSNLQVQNGDIVYNPEINARVPLIYVEYKGADGKDYASLCSGTLISQTEVLTAAHCALDMSKAKPAGDPYTKSELRDPTKMFVIFSKDLNLPVNYDKDDMSKWNIYAVKGEYVHKDAFVGADVKVGGSFVITDQNKLNDVAIIELKQAVSTIYKTSALQPSGDNPAVGSNVMIAGYGLGTVHTGYDDGKSGLLRKAQSNILEKTNSKYLEIGTKGATNPSQNNVICSGDSGGPAFTGNDITGYTVVGVHSYSDADNVCGLIAQKSSYSLSVAGYHDWIKSGYLTDSIK